MSKTVSNNKVKIGIYLCALLMMGAIAVSSNLSNIIAAFPEANQTMVITYMVSVPCLIVIPMTLLSGILIRKIPSKILVVVGVFLWLVGGVIPFFMDNLTAILCMRVVFGIGLGLVQSLCSVLIMENFEDPEERNKIMGNQTAFQMLGTIIFSIVAGNLGAIQWNIAFLVHLIAIISLIAAVVCLPYRKPQTVTDSGEKIKFQPTGMMWVWCISFFIFMAAGQAYSNFASSIITELNLGGSAAAGYSLALFSLGGLITGFIFAKIANVCKKMTLTVGCILLAVSYLIMTIAPSLVISYIGAFVCGLAFSICMPCILTGAGNSVAITSSAMAVSIATCMQNAGMSLGPYIVTPLGAAFHGVYTGFSANQWAMLSAMLIILIFAIGIAFINKGMVFRKK